MRLDDFLSRQGVAYRRLPHPTAFTANRIAQFLHVPGKEMAKTVLLRVGEGYALMILPATHRVDLDRARLDLGASWVGLATESEMEQLFPDCERGAVPPFGSLYTLPTLIDESLAEDEEIVFEGATHHEAIRMRYQDFLSLEHPRVGHFARRC